jgi:RHS repeat-associated protein
MPIHSHLPYDHSTSHARVPAGGIHLIASIDSISEAQGTVSFFGSTKALHGEVAIPTAETSTHNHSNQQYSITAVTTSAGTVAERYAYSAYGEPTICDASGSVIASSTINNRYSYTGREWDATVGLHHFRARWMSPKSGRFLGRDPIGFESGDLSVYRLSVSQPINRLDPSGHESWIPFPVTSSGCVINPITGLSVCSPPPPPTPWAVWPTVLPPFGPPVPPKPPTIGGYGHYCGPGRAAFCTKKADGSFVPSPGQPPPIDDMDKACMQHDCCLAQAPQVLHALVCRSPCNTHFCKALDVFECGARYSNDPVQSYLCDRMKQQAKSLFHCP